MHFCCVCVCVSKVDVCRLVQFLFLLFFTLYSNFGLLPVINVLLVPACSKNQNYLFVFHLPSENVAKRLLSGSAREHGIWYQAPS